LNDKTDIQCPACKSIFKVDISKIPEKGCHVNCRKCKERFLVSRPPATAGEPVSAPEKKVNLPPAAGSAVKATSANSTPIVKAAPASKNLAKKAIPTKRTPIAKAAPATQKPIENASPANRTADKKASPSPSAKPGKKKNYLLVGSLAGAALLVGIGAVLFLSQKYSFQIKSKDSGLASQKENTQNITTARAVPQRPVDATLEKENSTAAVKKDIDIGDLFNRVNPAVATVLTYDSGNNIYRQGSGFFISQDGDFITNYHVLQGAYQVVIKFPDETEYRAEFVLAANEQKDLIKLAVNIPQGKLKPGCWLEINKNPPNIADKIIVIGTPMGLGRTVSDGIISAIREIPDRGLTFQMTAPISSGSSGSPVIDMNGQVVGVAFLQLENGQNLNFAIPGDNIINLEDKQPLTIADWTDKISRNKNDTLDMLQKEIVKHIKQDKPDEKKEKDISSQPTHETAKTKLASEIIKESGIARQNDSLTDAVLSSFEEKYKAVHASKIPADDQKYSRFKDVIRLATDPERINQYIQKHLASSLSIAELEQVLKWYKSPLGKKISELEYSTYADKKQHVNTLRLAFNLTRYQSTSRADLFSRLDEATTSTEAMVELQTNLIVQNQILDLVLSNSKELDQASIDKIIQDFETDIDPYLDTMAAQMVFAGFVYTYRGLSKAELEAYLSFSETEAGKNYYSILNKKSNTILLDCNRKILISIVRVMNADAWENIRRDLSKPIDEA